MDISTFNSLKAAFQTAPSGDLAQVLARYCLEREDYQQAESYIEQLPDNLPSDEFCALFRLAYNNAHSVAALVDRCTQSDFDTILTTLLDNDNAALARCLWKALSDDRRQSISTVTAERLDERSKLKLVDNSNVVGLIDLARYQQDTISFEDVVGLDHIKQQINRKIILPFQKPSLFRRFRKKVGGGVLLYGPPGCGKTLLARSTAGECKAHFFNVEITDVLDMYIGESEQKLRAIFEKARAQTPSVLFFDELEALAGKREHMRNASTSSLVSLFLTELDGFAQANSGVLVLASTNVPWSVDPAFLRPGRFDRMFFVPPPDSKAREAILIHHMKDRPAEKGIDFRALAQKTGGYSGADLDNLVDMAADEAIEESMDADADINISTRHFKNALSQSRSTTIEWLTTARNYARYANDGGRYDDVLEFLKRHGK